MIHQDDFKNYKYKLLSSLNERTCSLCFFLFSLIYCSAQSQIFQKENNSIYITKGTKVICESYLDGSSSSENVYVLDGTITTGLREINKSRIPLADLRNKHPKKNLKQIISKKRKTAVNSKANEGNLKIIFKNNSENEKFLLIANNFLTAVAPTNSNFDKLLSILKSNTVQFVTNFWDKILTHQNSTSEQIEPISNFHSIRPPPNFQNSHNRVLSTKNVIDT